MTYEHNETIKEKTKDISTLGQLLRVFTKEQSQGSFSHTPVISVISYPGLKIVLSLVK